MADERNDATKPQKKEVKIEIKADEALAGGVYTNFMMIHQTETEFTVDFLYALPQLQQARLRSRVLLTPMLAKRLLHMLGRQMEAYEKRFGTVPLSLLPPSERGGSPDDFLN